jgi:hypothetical protein
MGVLAVAVRAATVSGDSALPLRICSFLNDALMHQRVVPEIENAVAISFVSVEELRATVLGRSILEHMPARVQQILVQQGYRDKAH